MRWIIVLVLALGLTWSTIDAGPEIEHEDSVSIDDFAWLTGLWVGPGFGGTCEEMWMPASGGNMLGTFRLLQDGEVKFFEMVTLSEDSAGFVMKVKHFNSDHTGWEDKNDWAEFRCTGTTSNELHFGGLTYRQETADSVTVTITLRKSDGSTRQELLTYRRARLV